MNLPPALPFFAATVSPYVESDSPSYFGRRYYLLPANPAGFPRLMRFPPVAYTPIIHNLVQLVKSCTQTLQAPSVCDGVMIIYRACSK